MAMEEPGTKFRVTSGFGKMTIGCWEMPAGPGNKAFFEGLPNNSCHCPHWDYVLKGKMTLHYDSGEDEVISAGDIM